jgi:hypothetical protein
MTPSRDERDAIGDWRQMRFRATDGHTEVLWVAPARGGAFRVLNVPVWLYGISVGTLVSAQEGDRWLEYESTVLSSPGATIRVYLPPNADQMPASRVYLERVFPDCTERNLAIGPATFFDPRVVAIHLQRREEWDTEAAAYFNELVDQGIAELWEIADPDMYPPEEAEVEEFDGILVHPRPTLGG